jgi:hypothetical protein
MADPTVSNPLHSSEPVASALAVCPRCEAETLYSFPKSVPTLSSAAFADPSASSSSDASPWDAGTAASASLRRGTAQRPGLVCPQCSFVWNGDPADVDASSPIERCGFCGHREFYLQKNFNRSVGLWIVIGSFAIVFLVMLTLDHRLGIYLLLGLAVVDWLAYVLLPVVTVCYLCQTVFRGFPKQGAAGQGRAEQGSGTVDLPNASDSLRPEHRGFYLGLEEKHKHLRKEWLSKLGCESETKGSSGPPNREPDRAPQAH